jgi:hypothetical protein
MILRDPLLVPCLTDEFWETFPRVNGRDLARVLSAIRAADVRVPMPRISGLTPEERLAREHEYVDRSITYASAKLGLV